MEYNIQFVRNKIYELSNTKSRKKTEGYKTGV